MLGHDLPDRTPAARDVGIAGHPRAQGGGRVLQVAQNPDRVGHLAGVGAGAFGIC